MSDQTPVRLNPFAFPSETNARFILLLSAAFATTITVLLMFMIDVGLIDWYNDAESWRLNYVQASEAGSDTLQLRPDAALSFAAQLAPQAIVLTLELLAIAAVSLSALFFYYRHPKRVRRKYRLSPWPEGKDPDFVDSLKALADHAGVSPTPQIEVQKNTILPSAQVFGRRGSYRLRLGRRMNLLSRQRFEEFKARILHELAHIANGDVGRAYWTQAIWLAAVIPVVLFVLFHIGKLFVRFLTHVIWGGELNINWLAYIVLGIAAGVIQAGAILVMIRVIRASVLRVRELYADARAALWGAGDALVEIFEKHASREGKMRFWQRIWRVHPAAEERLDAVRTPKTLFLLTLDLPLIVGMLQGLLVVGVRPALVHVINLIETLPMVILFLLMGLSGPISWPRERITALLGSLGLTAQAAQYFVLFSAILAVGALGSGTLGLQVERQAMVRRITTRRYRWPLYLDLVPPSIAMALGIQAGFILSPLSTLSPASWGFGYQGWLADYGWFAAILITLYFPISVVAVWGWLATVQFLADRMLGMHFGNRPPNAKRLLITLSTGLIIGLLVLAAVWGQEDTMWTQDSQPQNPYITLGIAVGLCVLVTIYGWLSATTRLFRRGQVCANCNQPTRHKWAVGNNCEHCGAPLAAWLYNPRQ